MSTLVNAPSLKEQWIQFRKDNPRVRIRDAAKQLKTTEASILASFAGSSVMRLQPDWAALLDAAGKLGYVMSLTRNEYCVHERKGVFENIDCSNKFAGLVVGPDIDLRMFYTVWKFAFAVLDDELAGFKSSLQIFDGQGNAVIKIFLTEKSNVQAFQQLVRDFSLPVQETGLELLPPPAAPQYKDGSVDVEAFRADWAALKDTHDFFPLLKKYGVSRLHALEIAGTFATKVDNNATRELLETASREKWEIMVFVGNRGNIQIHTGPVEKIVEIPGWINVMDPIFNLHLKLDAIHSSWLVKKPTVDGTIHSLEVFDAAGEMIVQFFGKRKPGIPELDNWREGIQSIAGRLALKN
ncbi:MAG: ChuX/HutX family heme-like substrate-binding protein [Flavihumibacter sp.]